MESVSQMTQNIKRDIKSPAWQKQESEPTARINTESNLADDDVGAGKFPALIYDEQNQDERRATPKQG